MGDRGNICVSMNNGIGGHGQIYLYTHWNGSCLYDVVHDVLKRRIRWDDDAYLTRMLFCELMIHNYKNDIENIVHNVKSETGFGVSLTIQDNEHPIVYVNPSAQTVTIEDTCWTFEDFIKG